MTTVMKYLFPGIAAGAMTYFLPHVWKAISINALGYELQGALVVGLAAIAGGIIGDKMGMGSGGGSKK